MSPKTLYGQRLIQQPNRRRAPPDSGACTAASCRARDVRRAPEITVPRSLGQGLARQQTPSEPHHVLGAFAAAHPHALEVEQRQAWEEELDLLRTALSGFAGTLNLEFDVPRLGSRIDAGLISGSAVFPIAFKCGESQFRLGDYPQAWDYALFYSRENERPPRWTLVESSELEGTGETSGC